MRELQEGSPQSPLKVSYVDSPLGAMLAIADEEKLYLLEFSERRGLAREIERLQVRSKANIIPGTSAPLRSIIRELQAYFAGELLVFSTPCILVGSPFQLLTWEGLQRIPYGETRSYGEQARSIARPTAHRAVANANGANQLALIVPCHRVITSNGAIGGYGGGVERKKWLLELEKKHRPLPSS